MILNGLDRRLAGIVNKIDRSLNRVGSIITGSKDTKNTQDFFVSAEKKSELHKRMSDPVVNEFAQALGGIGI